METNMLRYVVADCVVFACCLELPGAEPPSNTIEKIKAAWKKREDKIREIRVEWIEDQFEPKGVLSNLWQQYLDPYRRALMNPTGMAVPPVDTRLTVPSTLTLRDKLLLYEADQYSWHPNKGQYVLSPLRSLFDGKVKRDLHPKGGVGLDWPQGGVLRRAQYPEATGPNLRSLMMAVRPLTPVFNTTSLDELQPSGRIAEVAGRQCIELQSKNDGRLALWLDSERDYSVVRVVSYQQGRIWQQTTTEFSFHEQRGWLPSGWEVITNHRKANLPETYRAKVKNVSFESVDPAVFKLSFPPNTRVYDETRPQGEQNYITKAQGRPRIIHRSEIGKTYHELLESDPPSAAASWSWWKWTIPFASGLFLAGLLGRWYLRKRASVVR